MRDVLASYAIMSTKSLPATRGIRVRTITAGVALERLTSPGAVERALGVLARARSRFEREGYEVQTTRVTLPPLVSALGASERDAALEPIRALDALVADGGAVCSLGPV